MVAESVEEGLGAELGEHALDMQVVGAAPPDLRAVVCQPGHEGASVEGAAQGFVIQIQDTHVAAVAAQGVKGASTGRGRHSETHRPRSGGRAREKTTEEKLGEGLPVFRPTLTGYVWKPNIIIIFQGLLAILTTKFKCPDVAHKALHDLLLPG